MVGEKVCYIPVGGSDLDSLPGGRVWNRPHPCRSPAAPAAGFCFARLLHLVLHHGTVMCRSVQQAISRLYPGKVMTQQRREVRAERFSLSVTRAQLAAYNELAQRRNLTLFEWARWVLDAEVSRQAAKTIRERHTPSVEGQMEALRRDRHNE